MVNWIHLLREMEDYQERQRLLTRLIKWIEQEAKQDRASPNPTSDRALPCDSIQTGQRHCGPNHALPAKNL
jgi:hypothetical protein